MEPVARLRDRKLAMLHLVVAAALLPGLITISRIFGATWFYLTLGAFGTTTLVLVAIVTWADPVNLGGQGLGLMLELERQGYDARAGTHDVVSLREHRIVSPDEADAEIHVAVGVANIERARSHPGSVEVAIDDPRTSDQIETCARLRDRVIDRLVAAGRDALVPQADGNIFGLAAHKDLPEPAVEPLYIMSSMPQPIGVFTWDPTT